MNYISKVYTRENFYIYIYTSTLILGHRPLIIIKFTHTHESSTNHRIFDFLFPNLSAIFPLLWYSLILKIMHINFVVCFQFRFVRILVFIL